VLAYILGVILGFGHYFSEGICRRFRHREAAISFIAGISIAYLFLELFPLLFREGKEVSELVFVFVMLGFLVFFIFEKYVYQHTKTKIIAREISHLHAFGFFLYHFVIGMVLAGLVKLGAGKALLFFIPALLYSLVGEVSLNEVAAAKESGVVKALLGVSSLFGVVIGSLVFIPLGVNYLLLGFLVGAFNYMVVRDSLPRNREGNLAAFASGVALYTFLITFFWII